MIGVALLVVGWAVGWRLRRWVPALLAAVVVAHLAIEGQRLVMWPLYAVVAIVAIAVLVRSPNQAPRRGRWRTIGRAVVTLLLLVVVVPLPWLWPVMRLPTPTGPHPVGTSWLVVTDSSRQDRFAAGRVREFPVKVWYPAVAGSSGPRAPYASSHEVNMGGLLPPPLFLQSRYVRTHSRLDAPLAAGDGRFPTVVFSHGYSGYAAQNTPQMEQLASLGYVVFSIAHTGEASAAVFPDGRVVAFDSAAQVEMRKQAAAETIAEMMAIMARLDSAKTVDERAAAYREFLAKTPEPLRSESVVEWAADTRVLVDRLEGINAGVGASPFAGRLDLERLGIMGMSYGGATAGEFCRIDRRCRAGLNIDGGQFGALIDDSLTVPYFIMSSETARSVHLPILDVAHGPTYLVTIPRTTHIGLTDLSLLAPKLFRWANLTGRLDPDRRERLMTEYTVAFFDTYLKGQRSPLLDGPSPAEPDVSFVGRNLQ
jgi:predicted dienelactone hydrolase